MSDQVVPEFVMEVLAHRMGQEEESLFKPPAFAHHDDYDLKMYHDGAYHALQDVMQIMVDHNAHLLRGE